MDIQDQKPMTREELEKEMGRFMDGFGKFTDGYEAANPEWMGITLLQIFYRALEDFKRLLETPEETAVTWDSPIVELDYPIKGNWEKEEPYFFDLKAADLESAETEKQKLVEAFITVRDTFILRKLTREILIIIKNGKWGYKLPPAIDKKIAKLSKAERLKRIEKILRPGTKPKRFPLYNIPFGKKRAKASIIFQTNPCVLDVDRKLAYYPIIIGFEFKGITPKEFDAGFRAMLWEKILEGVKDAIPEESFDFLRASRPVPTARPVTKEAALVKAGLHAELQKFGHKPAIKQLSLFDKFTDETRKEVTDKSIEVVGLDITQAQNQALFAIQKLLTDTNYRGNLQGHEIDSKAFHFKGYLPALEFSPAQYLEAYGVTKHKTERGKEEFSGRERADALQALIDLAKTSFLFVYKRVYWEEDGKGKREEKVDRIETIATLFRIIRGWEALTKHEDALLDRGQATGATDEKLRAIGIEPAPILVQDINSYFVLKPANYLQEINLLYPWPKRPSKFAIRFIDWIMAQAELKRRNRAPLVIEMGEDAIARALRMDAYITSNQSKRIRQILNNWRYNRNLCMKGTSVSYVGSSHLTWHQKVPKGYAHEEDYRKSGRRSNDFGIGDGPGSVDSGRRAEDAPGRVGP